MDYMQDSDSLTKILHDLFVALRDPSLPSNRVFRKISVLTLLLCAYLVFYRHFVLQFHTVESILVSVGSIFIIIFVVGLLGGSLAAGLYGRLIESIGWENQNITWITFMVEWLVALIAPLLGLLVSGMLFMHIR